MFLNQNDTQVSEYKTFWKRLNEGEFQSGEFKRLGKNGKEVWIRASYNPIMNKTEIIIFIRMRMCIFIIGCTMGGPAGMTNTYIPFMKIIWDR